MALAGGPTKPKVGELGEKGTRNATLVEGVKKVRNEVGQDDSHRQRGQRCRQLGVVGHRREGDRPENIHDAGGRKQTNLPRIPEQPDLLRCNYFRRILFKYLARRNHHVHHGSYTAMLCPPMTRACTVTEPFNGGDTV